MLVSVIYVKSNCSDRGEIHGDMLRLSEEDLSMILNRREGLDPSQLY